MEQWSNMIGDVKIWQATRIRQTILELICFLLIFLFVYAAMGKLLVFTEFKMQMGQSDMLTPFVDVLAWLVPLTEILTALLLFTVRFKKIGLYASYVLMVMFTTYIVVVLKFSGDIPCSCGGVIEKLGWTEHLIFNVCFMLMALLGIVLISDSGKPTDSIGR